MNTASHPSLILVGAGGFARELDGLIRAQGIAYDIKGFLDNNKTGPTILGKIDGHQPKPDALYVNAVGDPDNRRLLSEPLERAGARFANVIAPQATVASELPENGGVIMLGGASVSTDCRVGRHTLFQGMALLGHDASVGDYCVLSAFTFIGGYVRIGKGVTIFPHATILPKVTIGDGAIIGAGSVVVKDVEPYTTVFGNPARLIERRQP
ncbi:NeuD/PglB/VioB family sugar acetyltransferase [Herbaspirillum sp. WKF16]|jgi:sugar O-acyltransferase (sialic acid O-acetyltransferase NeuD family)|uniref:NeuD/PglB/VioB family sugar acetyltransferase n=1 Tax=Herbaspirillum sp. WKF16 TaxID=3028312 RepID=UPI0023A9E0DD|nr:NeuD/PglB/VioB family sugar acetyltransferase [Herbaspirillum sp. WKF16]WDZ95745.1 NeuD/PglB/VioB family sugar acetyltransferase [Herbaspirillum sp. WKF16]